MKKRTKYIVLGLLIAFVILFGSNFFVEYMSNHQYYKTILSTGQNWNIVLGAILSTALPLAYIVFAKHFSLKKFIIYLWGALVVFTLIHIGVKDKILELGGFFMTVLNSSLLYGLGLYTITSLYTLGDWISEKLIKFKQFRLQELFINFGLGLGVFLLINWIIMGIGVLFPIWSWIVFLAGGVGIYLRRKIFGKTTKILEGIFQKFSQSHLQNNGWNIAILVLIGFSIMYYLLGFQLSFIPYPTAWDANHEYMYIPKVIAEYNGVIWGNSGPAGSLPYLWHTFITYFFSLIKGISSWFWISADTVAIQMNFLSGIFVLFFGLGLIHTVKKFFITEDKKSVGAIEVVGFTSLLLRLTSGMGAFLVFVDNKTDLGVMALTVLAILGGVIAIQYATTQLKNKQREKNESRKYLLISGLFFTFAIMSKPTGFIDVVVFGIFIITLWFNTLIGLGVSFIGIGLMGLLQPLNAKYFIDAGLGKLCILIGAIIVVIGLVMLLFQKKQEKKYVISYVKYILIWGLAFVGSLLVLKTPGILYNQYLKGELSIKNYFNGVLYASTTPIQGEKNPIRYAQNTSGGSGENTAVQVSDTLSVNQPLTYDQCEKVEYTTKELEDKPKIEVGNEDIGRYVGYGWHQFKGNDWGYYLLKIFFPSNGVCYGLNTDAKLLCKHANAIQKGDITVLEGLKNQVDPDSKVAKLLVTTLQDYSKDSDTLRYNIEILRQYYQDHSILSQDGVINIPYRYIIPLNITFNRSLQNLSSYYTDIGYIWLILMWMIIFAFGYALISRKKELTALSLSVIAGWMIWILIGGGILWYGIGLIMWTILVNIGFLYVLYTKARKQNTEYFFFVFIVTVLLSFAVQMVFNITRIASQGGGQPFLWYKETTGFKQVITNELQQKLEGKMPYTDHDVFDLQFGFYTPIIEKLDTRTDKDAIIIAGTYMQYFLKNQKNIYFDTRLGFLSNLAADGNVCKTYKRMQKKNLKYIVFDTNIGTVVMGEGNKSLFYRFFAKYNEKRKVIEEEGTLSMLLRLKEYGYLELFRTNNLGTKYAFILSDKDLMEYFKLTNPDQIHALRARLSVLRYFPEDTDLINFVATTFQKRFAGVGAIEDIADIYGKQVDAQKIAAVLTAYMGKNQAALQQLISQLSQDDKLVLLQWLSFYSLRASNPNEYTQYLGGFINNSVGGSTQVTAFEIK